MNRLPTKIVGIPANREISRQLFEQWAGYLDVSNKSLETYTRCFRQFLKFLQNEGIRQPDRNDIIRFRDLLSDNHKPTTIATYMSALRLFFSWTAGKGYYPNIADRVKSPKLSTQEHKKDPLSATQARQLLSSISTNSLLGKRDYAIIALMLTTGLRTISVSLANIEDIRSLSGVPVLFYQGKGKTEKSAYVKLEAHTENAIRDYMICRGQCLPGDPLFISVSHRNFGERITTRSLSRLAKNALIRIGLLSSRLTAHSLRHTAATLNLLAGGSLEETQQLLGHSSITTTQIYSHALDRIRNQAENRIGKAIFE